MATSYNGGRPFPEDLAEEILVTLPVESLLRFKCACKSWYRIIKNPCFIKQHLKKNKNKPPQILAYDHSAPDDSPPITLIPISGDGVVENPPDHFQRVRGMTYVLGSVDGLFLLERQIDGSIYNVSLALWNPATSEVRPLPEPNFELQPCLRQLECEFGFGLDPVTDDYKVVWFRGFWDDIRSEFVRRAYAAVYSCSRDSWRILQPENYEILIKRYFREALGTAYLSGAYYWLIRAAGIGVNCSILSFDFANEMFCEIEGPDAGRPFDHSDLYLILLDDSIALMTSVGGFDYEIWVMIQPGVWNKRFTFECFVHSPYFKSWNPSTLIYVSSRSRLISYDVRTQETRRLGFRHPRLRRSYRRAQDGCSVHIYKESLVPIKREKGEPHHWTYLTP